MSNAEDNYKRLRAELDELLSKDKRLAAIAEKITRGKATFKDSARYTQIVSKHMSDVIKRNIGDIKVPMGKEMVCRELLRDHYELINGIFGDVQVSVDEKLGIHLKPVKPAYPAERVDSWAHSLEDPTVEQSVIERRAASGSENIGNSMHDDCIKENAKWREQAGLDSYIVRDAGGGCCKWCAALEGRYRYADAPDDVFKRHDNCTCTVTYECGRKRQDVWSKKTWEASDEELNARKEASENSKPKVFRNGELKELSDSAKPKVFTPAEAKELERQALEKNPVTKLSPEQAQAINEQSKPTVHTPAEAKELEDKILGKINKNDVEFSSEKSIIKNIEIEDIQSAVQGGSIQKDVAKVIYDTLKESGSQNLFDDVVVINTDSKIVMQTDPVRRGTFFDTRLNLNEGFLGGKSVEQLDKEIRDSKFTVANSLREASLHEVYHAKLISGLNQDQLEALYDELSDIHIDGISKTAWKDGAECIAEVGVLFERGDTDWLPNSAIELFNRFLGGLI